MWFEKKVNIMIKIIAHKYYTKLNISENKEAQSRGRYLITTATQNATPSPPTGTHKPHYKTTDKQTRRYQYYQVKWPGCLH
jgi:hypothetical protein